MRSSMALFFSSLFSMFHFGIANVVWVGNVKDPSHSWRVYTAYKRKRNLKFIITNMNLKGRLKTSSSGPCFCFFDVTIDIAKAILRSISWDRRFLVALKPVNRHDRLVLPWTRGLSHNNAFQKKKLPISFAHTNKIAFSNDRFSYGGSMGKKLSQSIRFRAKSLY